MPGQYYTYPQARTLITELLDEVWEAENPEAEFAYNSVFNVGDMKRGEEKNYRIAGLDKPSERQFLEDLAFVNYKEGEVQTITPINWGAQMAVPKEVLDDLGDAGPWDGMNASRIASYADFTRRMKYNCFWRADAECALKLVNGTSTAARYVGRDNKALFSATQTGLDNPQTVQSNLSTGLSFTANNVMTFISAIRTQKDDRGQFIAPPKSFTVVTSEQLAWSAWEIFNSEGQVDTANNTKNPLYGMKGKIKHVVWNELGASYTGWFVLGSNHELHWKWRQRPAFERDSDFSANALKWGVTMRGVPYHKDWRSTAGAPTS